MFHLVLSVHRTLIRYLFLVYVHVSVPIYSFAIAAPTNWNTLLLDIRNSVSICCFRCQRKTFYYNLYLSGLYSTQLSSCASDSAGHSLTLYIFISPNIGRKCTQNKTDKMTHTGLQIRYRNTQIKTYDHKRSKQRRLIQFAKKP